MSVGAVAFFQKPINNDELLQVIHETVGDPPPGAPAAHDPSL